MKKLVAEVEYESLGSFHLVGKQIEAFSLGDIKNELLEESGVLENGIIDEENWEKEHYVNITFKNMTEEEIKKMGEFQGF